MDNSTVFSFDSSDSSSGQTGQEEMKRPPIRFSYGACFLPFLWLMFHGHPGLGVCVLVFIASSFGLSIAQTGVSSAFLYALALIAHWAISLWLGLVGNAITKGQAAASSESDSQRSERLWNIAGVVFGAVISIPATLFASYRMLDLLVRSRDAGASSPWQ